MSIGQRLIEALKLRDISQSALSIRMGVSRQAVNGWTKDRTEMPLKTALQLCEILDVSADWLLMGKDRPQAAQPSSDTMMAKDLQIQYLEQALEKAEAKVDALNQQIGALKKQSLLVKEANGQAQQKQKA
jgi:transcriptional regulator with XRE-family HTH domain